MAGNIQPKTLFDEAARWKKLLGTKLEALYLPSMVASSLDGARAVKDKTVRTGKPKYVAECSLPIRDIGKRKARILQIMVGPQPSRDLDHVA